MKGIISVLLILFCGAATAQNVPTVQVDNSRNSCSDYLRLKKEIDDVTKKILDDYARDRPFIAKFKRAQSAWESFRDAQLEMQFSDVDKGDYGSAYPTCRCNALVDMTNQRLDDLVRWISNVNDGQSCGGSINSTKRKSFVRFNER